MGRQVDEEKQKNKDDMERKISHDVDLRRKISQDIEKKLHDQIERKLSREFEQKYSQKLAETLNAERERKVSQEHKATDCSSLVEQAHRKISNDWSKAENVIVLNMTANTSSSKEILRKISGGGREISFEKLEAKNINNRPQISAPPW